MNRKHEELLMQWIERTEKRLESLERLEGMQGPERLLVGEPRSGSQPAGAEARSGEDAGVGKTVEQSECPACEGYGMLFSYQLRRRESCFVCQGTGQRSGLSNSNSTR